MESKFRVWDTLQHKLLVPDYIEFLGGKPYWVDVSNGNDGFQDDGDPQSMRLEQFTGLKDRNGKEIYVGDIVESAYKYAQAKLKSLVTFMRTQNY